MRPREICWVAFSLMCLHLDTDVRFARRGTNDCPALGEVSQCIDGLFLSWACCS